MKRTSIFIAAVLALAGCAKVVEQDIHEGQQITITASFAENQTKTTLLDSGTSVYWESGDEVKLFYKETGSRFTSTNTEIASVADFTGTLNVVINFHEGFSASTPLWGLYPYKSDATSDGESVTTTLPSEQTGKAGSFAKGMNLSLAKSTSLSMGFYNVCGGVRFSLTRSDVKNVVFKSLNGESVAGKVKLAFEDGVPVVQEIVEGVDSIVLTAPAKGAFEVGKWYYIVALPETLSGGFKMTFNTETKYAVLESTSSKTIKRGIFGSLADADSGLKYKLRDNEQVVDLGLSVKWADCNIGADSPEEYGTYFAWGDVVGQTWNGSFWSGGGFNDYPAYELDENNNLKPEYDAAHVNLGGCWRMPTLAEYQELIGNCTSTWTSNYNGTGVAGCIFTSRKDGYTVKSIFLPAAGNGDGSGLHNAGYSGYSWSSTFNYDIYPWYLNFGSGYAAPGNFPYNYGFTVRPVYDESIPVTGVSLNPSSISIDKGSTYSLTATITPSNATNKSVTWSSSDESVASVSSDGVVTANVVGSATITVTTVDGGKTASCTVTVIPQGAVDLGLSVKWRSCNVGASRPEGRGTYFAWGNVIGQAWNGSSWSGGGFYATPSYELDANGNLKPDYDAAHVKLGETWRMPTKIECQELLDNCISTWTTDYEGTGVAGRIFTSKKEGHTDKSIFLPASGYGNYMYLNFDGSYCHYWSSTYNEDYAVDKYAWTLHGGTSGVDINYYKSYYGQPVRPVCE